jgi:hypothetical protein
MRSTLILEVDDQISEFINSQQGLVDPSALVNKLLRDEMKREGSQADGRGEAYNDDIKVAMEEFVDENTPAAG